MTPHELRATLDRLDLSVAEAGHLLGVHRATIYRWLDGSIEYVLLHSLSNALMQEIALDCGYPASSLKERVYAHASVPGGMIDHCGLLIYTASAGAQGTLGGLVSIVSRSSEMMP
jgi:hypothetical protein